MVENIKDCERIHLFRDISREEIEKMFRCSRTAERSFEDGSYVFRQGETPKNLFLILEGSVMISKDFASGKRDVLFVVGQGDVFGEMYLFADAKTYWYDAIAQGKVKLLEIPWEFFYCFCSNACEHHRMITKNMLEIQSEKNFAMTRKLHLLSGTTLRERIALWLTEQADDSSAGTHIVRLAMNREELADYLGTTRPSLSRELMKMQQEQLIEAEKNTIKIVDRDALEALY
ncbi:MAG: Crp/Fnr family transcriptional regulator [Lachnospiraceae bacterium]|nr:Crp/Fnr family transcriptional regulator [Lachnospiraceae bacterium]MDE6991864.1 Crp/Fnr family transcriptional regulator [Lachnospiraceae bacterium]